MHSSNRRANARLLATVSCAALFGAAQPAFAQLQTQPALDKIFEEAMQARSSQEYSDSIKRLQAILAQNPNLGRARAELAVAYYQALNFTAARAEVTRLLADPSTPPNVRLNLQSLLAAIERDSKPHVFTPFVNMSVGHDTNINVGPGSSTVIASGVALTLAPGSTRQASDYLNLQAGLAHRYLTPYSFNLGSLPAALVWQSQASIYSIAYNANSAFNLNVLSASTGPLLLAAGKWRLGAPIQLDEISLGGSHIARYVGVTPVFSTNIGNTEITVDTQYQDRHFNPANSQRNSNYTYLGANVGHTLQDGKYFAQAGYRGFREHASVQRFSNSGTEYFVGGGMRPWAGGTATLRFTEKEITYKDVEPVFNVARDEKEQRVALNVSHLMNSGYLDKWTISASYNVIRNKSNVDLYVYDRHQAGVTLGRTF